MASLAVQQQSANPIATGIPGLYFYVNTITTPTDQNLQRLLGAVSNTGAHELWRYSTSVLTNLNIIGLVHK